MKTSLFGVLAAAAVGLGAAAFLFVRTGGEGDADAARIAATEAQFDESYQTLRKAFLDAEAQKAAAPSRADPAIAMALDRLGDAAGQYGQRAFPARLEFNACGKLSEIVTRYLYRADPEGKSGPVGGVANLKFNQRTHEIELQPLAAFQPRCFARSLQALNAASRQELDEVRRREGLVVGADLNPLKPEARNFDIRRRRLEDIRRGAAQALMALPMQATSDNESENYRRAVVSATALEAASLSEALPLEERDRTLEIFEVIAGKAPPWAQADIERTRKALMDRACVNLCARSAAM